MKTHRKSFLGVGLITFVCMALPVFAVDTDGDGLDDAIDNCREVFNRLQMDADDDGFGNSCDVDFNQDGFADGRDVRYFAKAVKHEDPKADINEDGVVDERDPIAATGLWGKPVGPGLAISDDDSDGVPLSRDLCPESTGGGTALLRGCTAIDLSINAQRLLFNPVVSRLYNLPSKLAGPAFDAFGNDVEIETLVLESAGLMASKGDPCGAAAVAERAADGLVDLQADLPALVAFHSGRVSASLPSPTGVPGVDWEDQDEFVDQMLPIWEAQQDFDALVESVVAVSADIESVCSQSTGPVTIRGEVVSVDGSRAELKLASGQLLGLANDYKFNSDSLGQEGALLPGVEIEATGLGFADGSVLATEFHPAADFIAGVFQAATCLKLKVIPFQLRPSYTGMPWIEHDALAYSRDGSSTITLESDSLLTVDDDACPPSTSILKKTHYAAKMNLGFIKNPFLKPGELFYLPDGDDGPRSFTLTMTTLTSECLHFPPFECEAPVPGLERVFNVVMVPRFSQCTAQYSETEFPLESAPVNAFAATHVKNAFFNNDAGNGSSQAIFSAMGIPVVNGSPGPGVDFLSLNEDFAVYEGDFRDAWADGNSDEVVDVLTGTGSRSGLVWPRMTGHRNGDDFWYSCGLPLLARDLLEYCNFGPGSPNAFYTMPLDVSTMGQGPNGAFSHVGAEAWDMSASTGTRIYAARRGEVVYTSDFRSGSCLTDPDDCPGNGITIRHDDGTASNYWHIDTGGSNVKQGEMVPRGKFLAFSDNTGFSSGPHLHFASQNNVDILFEAWKLAGTFPNFTPQKLTCHEPATGEFLFRESP